MFIPTGSKILALGPRMLLLAVFLILVDTARAADRIPLTTIAFGSCAHQGRSQKFWDPILKTKPDLFIFAGDNIYSDTYGMELMRKKYDQLGAQPGFQSLKASTRILATWDDHDYGLNDSGAEFPKKEESQINFNDFWEVPADSPRRRRPGIYDAHIFGPEGRRVQVILLDTRYFRSPLKLLAARRKPGQGRYRANTDKSATILGEAQWKWLEEQLQQPADVRLLVSSIQVVAQDHNWERWMNFPHERAKLFNLIRQTKANGVIVLSGDRHFAELSRLPESFIGYPLYDLTSSGLNMSYDSLVYEPNRHRIGPVFKQNNFGVVSIDWNRQAPLITLEIRDLNRKPIISESFPLSTLRPTNRAAPPNPAK